MQKRWTSEDDRKLAELLRLGLGPDDIAVRLDRDDDDVMQRIATLLGQFGEQD